MTAGAKTALALAALASPALLAVTAVAMGVGSALAPPPSGVGVDVDPVVLAAYGWASARAGQVVPGCALPWTALAAVGQVESRHGAGRVIDPDGRVSPPVVGVALDGRPGTRALPDSDGGRLDGDATWDRATGPMQFVPQTWATAGLDGNGDGVADPHNVFDAALAAAAYLCRAAPGDLTDRARLARALYSYNHSVAYGEQVLRAKDAYDALPAAPEEVP